MTARLAFNYLLGRALMKFADLLERIPSRRWFE